MRQRRLDGFISVEKTEINAPRGCAVILIGICQLRWPESRAKSHERSTWIRPVLRSPVPASKENPVSEVMNLGGRVFLFHRKLRPMKQKTLREDAHSREAEICRKRPRSARECAKAHSLFWSKTLDRLRGITRIIECLEYRYDLSAI